MKRLTIQHLIALPFVALALAIGGCVGEGTTTTTTTTTGGGGTATSVNRVDPNLSNIDTRRGASSSESVGLSASKSVAKAEGGVSAPFGTDTGDSSMAGCQGGQVFDECIRTSKSAAVFNCFLEKAEESIPNFDCSKETFTNHQVSIAAGGPQDQGFSMFVQCRTVGGKREVRICEGGKQTEAFVFDTSNDIITFRMKSHFTSAEDGHENEDFCDSSHDGTVSDDERAACVSGGSFDDWCQITGTVDADSAASGEVDSLSEFDSADVNARFDGGFGKGHCDAFYGESCSPSGGQCNRVTGGFTHSFGNETGTGFMHARFNSSEGSAKYSFTGNMAPVTAPSSLAAGVYCPIIDCDFSNQAGCTTCFLDNPPSCAASCYCLQTSASATCTFTDDGVESFSITLVGGKPVYKIIPNAGALFFNDVNATTLPTAVTPITKNFGDDSSDCSCGSSGCVQITIGDEKTLFAECFTLEGEAFKQEDHDTCFRDKNEADAQRTQ